MSRDVCKERKYSVRESKVMYQGNISSPSSSSSSEGTRELAKEGRHTENTRKCKGTRHKVQDMKLL